MLTNIENDSLVICTNGIKKEFIDHIEEEMKKTNP